MFFKNTTKNLEFLRNISEFYSNFGAFSPKPGKSSTRCSEILYVFFKNIQKICKKRHCYRCFLLVLFGLRRPPCPCGLRAGSSTSTVYIILKGAPIIIIVDRTNGHASQQNGTRSIYLLRASVYCSSGIANLHSEVWYFISDLR